MSRISLNDLTPYIRTKIPIENLFSAMLGCFILLLSMIVVLTPENERFIKNVFIYYIIVLFLIIILVMQASSKLNKPQRNHVKYKNISPSKKIERLIRENIMGTKREPEPRPTHGLKSTYREPLTVEKDTFVTPRADFRHTTTRFRPGTGRPSFYGETPRRDIFADEHKFTTPRRDRFGESRYTSVFDRTFTGKRDFKSTLKPRYSFATSKMGSPDVRSRFEYSDLLSGARDSLPNQELRDYESFENSKDKYGETIRKLKIGNKMKDWISRTRTWVHEALIKKIVALDRENLIELCRLLAKFRYSLVFIKEDFYDREARGTIHYEYEKIIKHYFNERHKMIDMQDLLDLEKNQDPVSQLYGKYFYVFKDGTELKIDDKYKELFDTLLKQRKDIEKYFTIEGFGKEARFYTFYRLYKFAHSKDLYIKYNSGDFFNGLEWTSRLPTDAQIIMWMFCTFLQRLHRDTSDSHSIPRIFYDYMDYHPRYKDGAETLCIQQVAPPSYAPLYKVIDGTDELDCLPGNDNVFNAVLFFMYLIKTKNMRI